MQTINIFRSNGEWAYALFVDSVSDHGDVIGVEDNASFSEAAAEAAIMFPGAEVRRVDDMNW